jgi:ABC-type lipoprotein release transport system permease subunit
MSDRSGIDWNPLPGPVPVRYHLRCVLVRKTASALTVVAIGFTVFILILVLSLAKGFEVSLADAGREDNVIFLRDAAMSEGVSVLGRDQARILVGRTEVAKSPADGTPFATPEFYAGIHLEKVQGGGTNISVRGTTATGLALRDGIRISEGRMFRPGTEEVVVGRGLVDRVKGCAPGGVLDFSPRRMNVVGVIDSKGGVFDSEVWGDVEVMQQVFMRESYSTVIARLERPEGLQELLALVKDNPNLPLKVLTEREYFRQQTGLLGDVLKAIAYFLASIMAVGAVFGSTNTLLASLAGRTREIGTLLAMGYRPMAIRVGFLLEALALGLAGGLLGALMSIPINGLATGTTNWSTFTEQTFAFAVTFDVVRDAVVFAGIIGVIGGVLPAFRAAGLPPTEALRA